MCLSNSPLGKVNNGNSAGTKAGWGDVNVAAASGVSDLWGMPKSRGPPPGLTASKSSNQLVGGAANNTNNSNGWGALGSPRWPSSMAANAQSSWMGSPWLLLRNLTAQVRIITRLGTRSCQLGGCASVNLLTSENRTSKKKS